MHQAVELAWESFRNGSFGIGATICRNGRVIATGRNRIAENAAGDDALAGSSVAHAEINALAKLPWPTSPDGLELWTTLQPCLQCLGAIRLSPVRRVNVLAPDPLFRGVEAARHLNQFLGSDWPDVIQLPVDEWSALSLLLLTHVSASRSITLPGWTDALPNVAALANELVASGELTNQATAGTSVEHVLTRLDARLVCCVPEIERLAASS